MTDYYALNRAAFRGIRNCFAAFTLLWLASPLASAQVASYSFTKLAGTYTPLPAGFEVIEQDPNVDDDNNTVNLGFTFRYNGVDYTAITVSNNGAVAMGAGVNYGYAQIADPTTYPQLGDIWDRANSTIPTGGAAVLAPFALDIRMDADSYLGLSRTGSAPNRRVTIEWAHERRYDASDGGSDDFNFQVILYEGSNIIEFVYGPFNFTARDFRPQVGIRGQDQTGNDFINIAASSGGFNAAGRTASDTAKILVYSAADLPTPGTTFRFAPIPPAPNDLGVVGFVSPRPDQTSCLLSAQERVRVAVRNFGTNAQTGASISYRLNNGTLRTETFQFTPSPLQPNSTDTVTFSLANSVDMSTVGVYNLRSWTDLGTEPAPNHINDTTAFSINLTGPINPPVTPLGTLGEATGANWKEAQGRPLPSGTTSNWSTGFPFASETYALIFNTSGGANANNNEWLLSPNYNLPSAGFFLIFKAAMTKDEFGSTAIASIGDDTVKVMISTDCGSTWRNLARFSQAELANGTIDNTLKEFRYPLSATPASVRVAFFGTSNNTPALETWRFHIDDVEFKEVLPTDLGVVRVLSPSSGQPGCLLGAQETVTLIVKNFGSATQATSPVAYKVQSASGLSVEKLQTVTFTPALQPGKEDTISFTGQLGTDLSQAGSYRIIAYTRLPGESSTTARNDTGKSENVLISNPLTLPAPNVVSNAQGNLNGWSKGRGFDRPTGTASDWGFAAVAPAEYIGMTFNTAITTPEREWWYSPSYAGTDYTTILYKAAVIAGGNGAPAPNGMEDDTVYLKVSNDCGGTWRTIRKFSNADVTSGVLSQIPTEFTALVPSAGQRVSFGFFGDNNATASLVNYRFVLDDIRIKNAIQNDQGVIRALTPFTNLAQCTQPCAIPAVIIRNYGASAQSSATVTYSLNGGTLKTETFTLNPPLAPGGTDTLTFSAANCADMSAPGTYTFRFFTTTTGEDSAAMRNDTLYNYVVNTLGSVSVPAGGAASEAFDGNINSATKLPNGWIAERLQAATDFQVGLGRGAGFTDALSTRMFVNNKSTWAVSPRYTIPSTAGTVLQFDFRIVEQRGAATILGPNDSMRIEVSTNCAQSWQRVGGVNMSNNIESTWHVTRTYPLDQFAGQEAVFRVSIWSNRTDANGSQWDIDNWRVGAPVSAKGKAIAMGYGLAPNPSRGRVLVTGPESVKASVAVLSSLGQQVASAHLADGRAELDLARLASGIYQVRITPAGGGKSQVITLVKE